ncbi:MAG: bifunctional riboflavin kinase/FAD synthetase [Mobilicoccus sp.]|nr:bifunctional riboflavin kinase/FAD synthetase [Mobilicoccus sp.]
MQRWTHLTDIPDDLTGSVVTLGNFDGVHRGHRAVLTRLLARSREAGVPAVAVTFEPHPIAVLFPERAPALIASLEQRLELLADVGLDGVLVMEFTRDLATWTPDRFVEEVFVDALNARAVVVGRDTRFGVRNSGDVDTLTTLGRRHGFDVEAITDEGETTSGEPGRWSSTQVRTLLDAGDVAGADRVLGRPHAVAGTVVHGEHRGREIGYPTANLAQDSDGLVPADGVYAGWLVRPDLPTDDADHRLPAAISVGTNPTFDGVRRTVEAYVLDRTDLDLYGERVAVEFVEHLRPMLRFDGVEELVERMAVDVDQARSILTVRRTEPTGE